MVSVSGKSSRGMSGLLSLCVLLTAGLGACSSGNSSEMAAEISRLKAENEKLKAQLGQPNSSTTGNTASGFIQPEFTDIADSPDKEYIHDLAMIGVFDGKAKEFKPSAPITRGEFATWLFKAHNAIMPVEKRLKLDAGSSPVFKDVSQSDPAYPYIQSLANSGFSVGYDDGTFKPDQPINRIEMIAMKVALDSGKNLGPDSDGYFKQMGFTDQDQVDKRYHLYVWSDTYFRGKLGDNFERAYGKVRIFKPREVVKRQEAAAVLWQFGQYDMYTAGKLLNGDSLAQKLIKTES